MVAQLERWWHDAFGRERQELVVETASGPLRLAWNAIGSGPPLVLLHGLGSWSYSFRHAIPPLARDRRVICLDLPNHGSSERVDYPVSEWGALALQAIASLTDEPTDVLAQSLGALVAIAAVQEQPDRFRRLVLANAPLYVKQLPTARMRQLASRPLVLIQLVEQLRLPNLLATQLRDRLRQTRREIVINHERITDTDLDMLLLPYLQIPGAIAAFARLLKQCDRELDLAACDEGLFARLQANLHRTTCPTLVLWSDRDNWFPREFGDRLAAELPDARLETLATCGHDAVSCCPEQVIAATRAFLPVTDEMRA